MKAFILAAVAAFLLIAASAHGAQVVVNFTDNSNDETGFRIERQLNAGAWTALVTLKPNITTYIDTTAIAPTVPGSADNVYCYRALAFNTAGDSKFTNSACMTFAAPKIVPPIAPSNMTTAALPGGKVDVFWRNNNKNQAAMATELTRVDSTAEKTIILAGWRAYYQDSGVLAGVRECYTARTFLGANGSLPSNESCATGKP